MFPLQLEELQTPEDLGYMERVFVLDQTDAEAAAVLLLASSLERFWRTLVLRLVFAFCLRHNVADGGRTQWLTLPASAAPSRRSRS